MNPIVSERTRQMLSQSLPLVQAHKDELVIRMQASLAPAQAAGGSRRTQATAAALVEMLLTQVRQILDSGTFHDLASVRDEHRALEIAGRTYSRFGDMLVPVLKDVLGPTVPAAVPGAWSDTFWSVIREVSAQPVLEAA